MAYNFIAANSRYLSTTSPVSGVPFTFGCWMRNTSLIATTARSSLVLYGTANSLQRYHLRYTLDNSGVNGVLSFLTNDGVNAQVNLLGSEIVSVNAWYHLCGVVTSTTSRALYVNGSSVSSSTATQNNISLSNLYIGCTINASGTPTVLMDGDLADAAIWSVALSDSEIASLGKGIPANLVRPSSLEFYAPLIRDLTDQVGGRTITNNNGAIASDHPRIY